MMAVVRP
jgi:hypothetical protein